MIIILIITIITVTIISVKKIILFTFYLFLGEIILRKSSNGQSQVASFELERRCFNLEMKHVTNALWLQVVSFTITQLFNLLIVGCCSLIPSCKV